MKTKGIYAVCFFLFFTAVLFCEDIKRFDDSTLIQNKLIAPTDVEEARNAYNIGTTYLHENKLEEAEEYLLNAISLDPGYVDAMDHLGLVYRRMKRYDDAENIYKQSIEINQNNSVPYINLALVYRMEGKLEDSRQMYLKAAEIDKDNPEPYYGIGYLYQMVKEYKTSIQFLNIAIQKYYEKESILVCDAYYLQGDNYYYLGEYAEALKYYKVAQMVHKDSEYLKNRIQEIEEKSE
ncbi:tetratricopeptide repeat protein [Breznakiella homolactica]|uniref:Tetratricopeptide repeat protein n=1 Tax=Breznakiella homolactica TaxID=2798577 RepID=A0A7T7XMW9_9SPIR|nr:tetratricopeptide repeat protein [Breznakiella homolactica]QQO09163.1 tetratricopeptide repeat protein [Breznakiella homolactica]